MTETTDAGTLIAAMLNAAITASTVEFDGASQVVVNSDHLRDAALGIVAMLIEADPRCQTSSQLREERDRAARKLLVIANEMRVVFERTGVHVWNGRVIVPN